MRSSSTSARINRPLDSGVCDVQPQRRHSATYPSVCLRHSAPDRRDSAAYASWQEDLEAFQAMLDDPENYY